MFPSRYCHQTWEGLGVFVRALSGFGVFAPVFARPLLGMGGADNTELRVFGLVRPRVFTLGTSPCIPPLEGCASTALLSDVWRLRHLSSGPDPADRAISTGQLNALLRLHLRPIDVVVFHGSQGDLVSRGASRLDAFSGYPVRT